MAAPIPRLSLDAGPFFQYAAEGELRLRACRTCGRFLHLPRARCRYCASTDLEWRQVSGSGRLYSWTVIRHQVHPAFSVPYCVVLVELDDAPSVRLPGYLPGEHELSAGQPMTVRFDRLGAGVGLPQFIPDFAVASDA